MQANEKTNDDLATILQISTLIDTLQKRPVESIAPYTDHLRVLSTNFQGLSRRLDVVRQGSNLGATPQPLISDKALRHKQAAAKALQSAIKIIPSLHTAIATIKTADSFDQLWLRQDRRIAHLQPINRLRGHEDSQSVLAHDRILLILSCHSLANDFQAFEKTNGWISKEDQLIARMSDGQDPSTQSIGKHLQNFLSTYSALPEDRVRIDAGVRFGTKLRVLDALSQYFGVGVGLPLLLGFEYQTSSRLSYNAFPALQEILESNSEQRLVVQQVSETVGSWFRDFLRQYHELYGSTSPASTFDSRLNSPLQENESALHHSRPLAHMNSPTLPQQEDTFNSMLLDPAPGFQDEAFYDVLETHSTDPSNSTSQQFSLLPASNSTMQDIVQNWFLECGSIGCFPNSMLPSPVSIIAPVPSDIPLEDLMAITE